MFFGPVEGNYLSLVVSELGYDLGFPFFRPDLDVAVVATDDLVGAVRRLLPGGEHNLLVRLQQVIVVHQHYTAVAGVAAAILGDDHRTREGTLYVLLYPYGKQGLRQGGCVLRRRLVADPLYHPSDEDVVGEVDELLVVDGRGVAHHVIDGSARPAVHLRRGPLAGGLPHIGAGRNSTTPGQTRREEAEREHDRERYSIAIGSGTTYSPSRDWLTRCGGSRSCHDAAACARVWLWHPSTLWSVSSSIWSLVDDRA